MVLSKLKKESGGLVHNWSPFLCIGSWWVGEKNSHSDIHYIGYSEKMNRYTSRPLELNRGKGCRGILWNSTWVRG